MSALWGDPGKGEALTAIRIYVGVGLGWPQGWPREGYTLTAPPLQNQTLLQMLLINCASFPLHLNSVSEHFVI